MIKHLQPSKSPNIETIAYSEAIKAAQNASQLVMEYWPNPTNKYLKNKLRITDVKKGTANFATIADEKSEQLIVKHLKKNKHLRNHNFLGEENAFEKSQSKYTWVIDPIDGTTIFSNGLPDFGVMIGLLKNNEPILGIIAMPVYDRMLSARIGHGVIHSTLTNKKKLNISKNKKLLKNSVVSFDVGYVDRGKQYEKYASKVVNNFAYLTTKGSFSSANYELAIGLTNGYFNNRAKLFDMVAPTAIINELGGIVTTIKGKPIDFSKQESSYLAAINPKIHKQLLKLVV